MNKSPDHNFESNQPSGRQWAVVAAIVIFFGCAIIAFTFFVFQSITSWSKDKNMRATETAAAATAVVVERDAAIEAASNWPLLIFDPFDNNDNEWATGDVEDEYTNLTFTLDEGKYTWQATANQGFVWRVWPRPDDVDDFYLAVDAHNISGNRDAQYGLIFRNRDDSYFFFEVRDTQVFRVLSLYQNEWIELIPSTFSEAIRPGDVNHLEVLVRSDEFLLYINGQWVGETTGSYPSEGQAGLAIGLSNAGDESTIVFDNFDLRAPPSK